MAQKPIFNVPAPLPNGTTLKPNAYASFPPGLSNAITESIDREESLDNHAHEEGSPMRIVVRITRRGTRLLDKDNLYGGVKALCDALRYAKLIPEDDPESIDLRVAQRKVKRGEEGTAVEIIHQQCRAS